MNRREKLWLAVLLAAVVVRVATLAAYPLHDTTEARYAEIARLMATTGDWVMPQIEVGVPFWGKPPLSIWLTAASFKTLGVSEFAARLPALLLTLLVAGMVYAFGRERWDREAALAAAAILLTTGIGFVLAGAVMTDSALVAATTLAMIAFWKSAVGQDARWRYVFFIAVAIGLLAKGPIAAVMAGVPVVAWLLIYRDAAAFRRVPWISGALLTGVLAVPWFLLAESRSPGFLEYFLVGEHWLRFVDSGWSGDLYGEAHARVRGTIWLFAFGAALPWSIPALSAAFRNGSRERLRSLSPLQVYLVIWMITPLVFFTLAGNILPTYVATGLPAFALLLGSYLAGRPSRIMHAGWAVPAVIVAAAVAWPVMSWPEKTQREIVAFQHERMPAASLYYYRRKPESADFYSRGDALLMDSEERLREFIAAPGPGLVAVRKTQIDDLPVAAGRCLQRRVASLRYVLFEKPAAGCGASDAQLEEEVVVDEQAREQYAQVGY